MKKILSHLGAGLFGLSIPLIISLIIFDGLMKTEKNTELSSLVIKYAKTHGLYNKAINYESITCVILDNSILFGIDPKLVAAHCIAESEFRTNAVNTNLNDSIDFGLMQINTIWNGHHFKGYSFKNIMFIPEYNIYAGCAIIKDNITAAKGDLLESVRRYNGSGPKAEAYSRKIINIYYELCSGLKTLN